MCIATAQMHIHCGHPGHTKIVAPCIWDFDPEHLICPNNNLRVTSYVPCHIPPLCPACYRLREDAIRAFHEDLINELRAGRLIWDPRDSEAEIARMEEVLARADANANAEAEDGYEMYAAESAAQDFGVHVDEDESSDEEENGGVPLPSVSSPGDNMGTTDDPHTDDTLGTGIDVITDQSMADAAARSFAPSPSLEEPAGELSDPPSSSNSPIDMGPGSFSSAFQEYEAEQAEQADEEERQNPTEFLLLVHFWEKRSEALARTNYEFKWEVMPRERWTVRDEELVRDGALAAFREEMGVFGDG
ncbi:MAG: hypothetical protein M1836_001038 [Candelina mexicana]|nr:MAG: hypothetical protein M1836_001038 [Candelina mexicana]